MNIIHTTLAAALTLGSVAAQAQATVKPDGQWRSALGLGASMSSGNSKATNLAATADAVRATSQDKASLYGNANYAKSNDTTTGEQVRLGGRYDYNLGVDTFAFGGLDLDHNKFANLSLRGLVSGGLGYHAIRGETTTLDLFGGLGYTSDRYIDDHGRRWRRPQHLQLPVAAAGRRVQPQAERHHQLQAEAGGGAQPEEPR
jgi:putative salt-induced outer membrane protein